MRRDLAYGIAVSFCLLWLTFFGAPGSVEVATLIVSVAAFIWFATVSAERLVDRRRRPHPMLFGLTALGVTLVLVAASVMSTVPLFLVASIAVLGASVGLVRAVRFGFDGRVGGP